MFHSLASGTKVITRRIMACKLLRQGQRLWNVMIVFTYHWFSTCLVHSTCPIHSMCPIHCTHHVNLREGFKVGAWIVFKKSAESTHMQLKETVEF